MKFSNQKYSLLTVLLLTVLVCSATTVSVSHARHKSHLFRKDIEIKTDTDSVSPLVNAYMDSLLVLKKKLDEQMALKDSLRDSHIITAAPKSTYAPLMMPLTFYHNIAHNELSMETKPLTLDEHLTMEAMLNVYLNRPDLVLQSEKNLPKITKADIPDNKPVQQKETITPETPEQTVDAHLDLHDPVNFVVSKPNFWKFSGDYSLQFMQNYFSHNWYKGGDSYYSMLATAVMEANYDNKSKIKWDNKLELKLGIMTAPSDTVNKFKTTEDLIRLTSKLGIQAHKHWYYTLQTISSTQFAHGLKSNDNRVYSAFMSPFNLNVSLGMEYEVSWLNKKLTGSINLSPVAYNMKYVSRLELATRYGLEEGRHFLHDYGSTMTVNLTWVPSKQFKWVTRLYAYTTYKKIEAEWENTMTLLLTKYISANIFLHPRFDDTSKKDSELGYFHFKEYVGLGFNYSF